MTLVHVEAVSNGYSYNSDGGETSLVTAVNLTGGGRIVLARHGDGTNVLTSMPPNGML